jgi:uncharacterized zinc-type alcohol dehydrogenase-like protein
MRPTTGYAVFARGGPVRPWAFERRALRPHDVALRIRYCGICHTDLHAMNEERSAEEYPLVPGHEIAGEVTAVGSAVTSFAVGDAVLVGTIVDADRTCDRCAAGMEQYCRTYPTTTYNGVDRIDGTRTRGGYSREYVADERFVYALPAGMDAAATAPLMCAGVTTYSALRAFGVGPGTAVGIVGVGGLGHVAIKLARAMGAHVVAFTTAERKRADARRLGAHEVVVSRDDDAMTEHASTLDFVLDTVSEAHPLDDVLATLKLDGTLCALGIPDAYVFDPLSLAMGRRRLTSSAIGGTRDTHEMLAFCAAHGIAAEIEVIPPSGINAAFARLDQGDVRYRFVVDMDA